MSNGLLSRSTVPRHKVFVCYQHTDTDQYYRNAFEKLFADHHDIFISHSVQIGDIQQNVSTEAIRQRIRDEYLRDSTVTVVLIGETTWQRKHVDWEIASSIRSTIHSSRSGLLGILLPNHSDYGCSRYSAGRIPPRLHDNVVRKFAAIYHWSGNSTHVADWIHKAYERRNTVTPDNSRESYVCNRYADSWL